MGSVIEERYPNEIALYNLPDDCSGLTMLELGNKRTTIDKAKGIRITWKSYFSEMGFAHTSVDWNGMDGALQMDLREPLNLGTFDYVTNIGTSEHVDRQEPVWRNMLEAMHVGSLLVSTTPFPGDWGWHGFWYPEMEFYESLADLNVLEIQEQRIYNDPPRRMIGIRAVRMFPQPFEMPKGNMYRNK